LFAVLTASGRVWRRRLGRGALNVLPGVHLIVARLPVADPGAIERVLSDQERARSERFRTEAARARHVTGRALLRFVAAAHTGADPREIAIDVAAGGKPFFPAVPDLQASVAHTDGVVVVAVALGVHIGVDVESACRHTPAARRIVERRFTAAERAHMCRLAGAEFEDAFLRHWMLKEAVGKALGRGIAYAVGGVSVVLAPDAPARLESVADGPAPDRWTLHEVALWPGREQVVLAAPEPEVAVVAVERLAFPPPD
jgi:4'-phosphopantetheinyl transferase